MIGDSDAAGAFSDSGHDPVGTAVDAAFEVALERTTDAEVELADVDDLADGVAGELASDDLLGGLTTDEQRRIGFYTANAKSAATRRAYLGAWQAFTSWCTDGGRRDLPASPQTVAAFLSYLADVGASLPTVVRHHAAIRHVHVLAGAELSTSHAAVVEVMAGVRRHRGPPSGRSSRYGSRR